MLIIKTKEKWNSLMSAKVYGQVGECVILETSCIPSFEYEELDISFSYFDQTCVPGCLFQSVSSDGKTKTRKPSIAELIEIKTLMDRIGNEAVEARTIPELKMMAKLKETEQRADAQDLLLFDLIIGGGI